MEGLFLSVAGFIIAMMIAIIGYFVNRLVSSVDKLEQAITSLNSLVLVQEEKLKNLNICLSDHTKRITQAEKEIQILKINRK